MVIKPNVEIRWLLEIDVGSFCTEIEYSSAGCSNVGFTSMGNLYYCLLGSNLFLIKKPMISDNGRGRSRSPGLLTLLADSNTSLVVNVDVSLCCLLLSVVCCMLFCCFTTFSYPAP
jgi:hypothetical protein